MKQLRTVRKIVTGKDTVDGAGVKLVRVIGYRDTAEFDPFLMLDAFDSTNPDDYTKGFPWHPHRGIETITYLVQGEYRAWRQSWQQWQHSQRRLSVDDGRVGYNPSGDAQG